MAQQNLKDIKSKSTRPAVAAIDFGTTYSGFAFSWKHDWSKVQVIENCSGNFLSMKVPTSLLLNPDKSFAAFGLQADTNYTEMAEKNDSDSDSDSEDNGEKTRKEDYRNYYYFHRFKMLLHENKKLHRNLMIKDVIGKEMKAMDVFSICIKYLKNAMLSEMNLQLAEGQIIENDIDFVLTVPAIWGDEAKLFMREAAIKAGIKTNQLTLALEPEAASIYCQHMYLVDKKDGSSDEDDTFKRSVEKGQKYMVVDLGGGTADITVHKRTADGTLEELYPATGGPLGGTSVDSEFEKIFEEIAGKDILKSFAEESMEDYLAMLRDFEAKKRDSSGANKSDSLDANKSDGPAQDPKVRIVIPLKLNNYIRERIPGGISKALQMSNYKGSITYNNYKLCLKLPIFQNLFQNAIAGIIKCVAKVLANKDFDDVKNIIMVGGFSECKFVQAALREKFKTRDFIIPADAGLAILKGAVYFGHLPNAISRRAARYTYGIQICRKFKPGEDPEHKKITVGGMERCKDVLHPLVKRGERIEPGCEYPVVCHSLKPSQGKIECGIYVSKEVNPKFVDEEGCRLLCKVSVQLPPGVNNAEIEEIITFGETEITFRARQLETGRLFETTFDMLDENSNSKK
ncbi:heat shock 70 kDa protein 12B-like [Magallana gigas]|uniref:heat shock 70 kDa protein 12B-like n=1 Tax=Magallana gigas TaxID=29159 RepID=UPI0033415909